MLEKKALLKFLKKLNFQESYPSIRREKINTEEASCRTAILLAVTFHMKAIYLNFSLPNTSDLSLQ